MYLKYFHYFLNFKTQDSLIFAETQIKVTFTVTLRYATQPELM